MKENLSAPRRVWSQMALLVVVQTAAGFVLVVTTLLLIRTTVRLQQTALGFDANGLTMVSLALPVDEFPTSIRRIAAFQDLARRLAALPGVQNVAAGTSPPLTSGPLVSVRVQPPADTISPLRIGAQDVTPDFFAVARIPILTRSVFCTFYNTLEWQTNPIVYLPAPQAFTAIRDRTVRSAISLLLAAIGIYGVVSQVVAARRREFGIRLALGARPSLLIRGIVGRMIVVGMISTPAGGLATSAIARTLTTMLYGITPLDAISLALAALILLAVFLLAALVPALPLIRIAPVETMTDA